MKIIKFKLNDYLIKNYFRRLINREFTILKCIFNAIK